jgi:hypothetical protein
MSGKTSSAGTRGTTSQKKQAKGPEDPCDLKFEIDLSAVDLNVLRRTAVGSTLVVDLVGVGGLESVVCRRVGESDVLGSLAAFEGLADLIDCIRRKNRYSAKVLYIDRARCSVRVGRTGP